MGFASYRLTTRIEIGAIFLVAAVIAAFILVIDRYQQQALLAERAADMEASIRLNGRRSQQMIDDLSRDTLFLARTPPVSGLMRAALNGGTDPREKLSQAHWSRRLQEIFEAYSDAHPQYFKIRFIRAAEGGRELLRVDYREGKVVAVPAAELQRVGDEAYFREAVKLKPGEVHLSPFGLNREHGAVEIPHRPTLRAATPVFSPEGKLFGVVVINMDAAGILDALATGLPPGSQAYVADSQGRYLLAPEPGLAFAAELGDERRLFRDFPDLAAAFEASSATRGPLQAMESTGGVRHMLVERLHYGSRGPDDFLVLAYSLPDEAVNPQGLPGLQLVFLGLLAGLLAGALVLLALRRLLSPLRRLTEAAEAIAGGAREVVLPTESGEVGALVRAFRHMLATAEERERECRRLNAELEQRVLERTAQLRLAGTVVDNTSEGVMVVGSDWVIVSVNPAFTEITGYGTEEAVGRTPEFMRSDYHEEAFYRSMSDALLSAGRWQGEIWSRRRDGEVFPAWLTINRIPAGEGVPTRYVGVFVDVTEQRLKEERIRHLAFHDALTGLPNRSLLFDRLQHGLQKARRESRGLAVMFLDLDRFKGINDTLGHEVGDLLLQEVARRLCNCLRSTDTVARMGGDEFVVLLENLDEPENAAGVATNLMGVLSLPLEIAGYTLQVGASIGIAVYPQDSDSAVELMKYADTAMYAAKAAGKGTYRFFRPAMTEQAARRLQLENELRQAVHNGELEIHYQPQVELETGLPRGAEALLRWRHPERGLLLPEHFIPLAEETGLMGSIGEWTLSQVCSQLAAWRQRGMEIAVAINFSARQLEQDELPERILALTREHGIEPANLQVELTEDILMAEPEKHGRALRRLREIGVSVAVDDFGTGYSSLAYLRRLPIDLLKIDHSFVAAALEQSEDAQVIRTIVALGQALHLSVLAEGVETEAQAALLRAAGCSLGQGFLFARPEPADVTEVWLSTRAWSQASQA